MNQLEVQKPTKEQAIAALYDMKEPSVWVPGMAAVIVLAIFGQSMLLCTGAVGITLYLNRLWSRLSKPTQQNP